MSSVLADYVKEVFPKTKSDLFSAFIEHGFQILEPDGYLSMITMQSWMFLSSFEAMRNEIIKQHTLINMLHLGPRGFDEIGGEVVQTTTFIMKNNSVPNYKGVYCRLIEPKSEDTKREMYLSGENRYFSVQENFSKIPGSPIAYWVSEQIINAFISGSLISKIGIPRTGMMTGNNTGFIRFWWEIESNTLDLNVKNYLDIFETSKKWFPYNKGGEYRKWYGNNDYVINYENQGDRIFSHAKEEKRNAQDYPNDLKFRPAISWSLVTSGKPSFRYKENHLSDIAGASLYVNNDKLFSLLAYLNSPVSIKILEILAPTVNCQSGDIGRLPVKNEIFSIPLIDQLAKENINFSKSEWDSFETSWDFKKHPLI